MISLMVSGSDILNSLQDIVGQAAGRLTCHSSAQFSIIRSNKYLSYQIKNGPLFSGEAGYCSANCLTIASPMPFKSPSATYLAIQTDASGREYLVCASDYTDSSISRHFSIQALKW